MSRVSEVTALQQQRIKEMQDRMKKEDVSDALKMQLMIQNVTQTLNDISATLAIIADEKTKK
jgi:esterase/lipase